MTKLSNAQFAKVIAGFWIAGIVFFSLAVAAREEALAILSLVTVGLTSPISAWWIYDHPRIKRWHVGKLLLLWIPTIVGPWLAFPWPRDLDARASLWAFLGIPLVSATWTWLSARENQQEH